MIKQQMRPKKYYWILALALIISFALRFYKLGVVPVGMYIDETAIGVDAYVVAETGKDVHGKPMLSALYKSYGDYKLPVYVLAASASVKIFGKSEFAVRFPSAAAGVASTLVVYFIAKQLFKQRKDVYLISGITAVMHAILPWDMLFSRTAFEGHFGQFLVLLMILFALKAVNDWRLSLLSALFGSLALYTYYSIRFIVPVMYCSILLFYLLEKREKKLLLGFGMGMLLMGLLFIPMLHSPLYSDSQKLRLSSKNILHETEEYVQKSVFFRERSPNSLVYRIFYHRYLYLIKELFKNYSAHVSPDFLFFSGDDNLRHSTQRVGVMLPAMLPFFLAGLYVMIKKYWKLGILLAIWFGISVLPAAVPVEVPHALRSQNAIGLLPIILGLGAVEIYEWLSKRTYKRILMYLIGGLLILNLGYFLHDYFNHYPRRSTEAWSDGNKQAALLIEEKRKSVNQIYVLSPVKLFFWTMFYGSFTPDEVREMISNASVYFEETKVGNIYFQNAPWWQKIDREGAFVIGWKDMVHRPEMIDIQGTYELSKFGYLEINAQKP